MSDSAIVISKTAAMFLVMLVGYGARRIGRIDATTTRTLGVMTADVCLPALTFTQLLATVDAGRLRSSLLIPALGAAVILLGHVLGWLGQRIFAGPGQGPTVVFLAAMANWIYLPLPIVQALHGPRGVEALLLLNVGAQLVLWTVEVATLRGGRMDASATRTLATNPGLLAAASGIAAALVLPQHLPAPVLGVGRSALDGLGLLGSLTTPLSLVVTGAQLGAHGVRMPPSRAALGVLGIRLLIAPALVVGLAWAATRANVPLPEPATTVTVLVAAMPVAVSCGILTEKYNQDTALAAEATFLTTLVSIVTVPMVAWAFQHFVR